MRPVAPPQSLRLQPVTQDTTQNVFDTVQHAVLVNLTIKATVDRPALMKVMPDEVRATVQLYLDGEIQQWFSRGDGRGVLFIMNCSSVAEAKGLMELLPLSNAGFADLEYTALGPLTPLRALIAAPSGPPAKNDR